MNIGTLPTKVKAKAPIAVNRYKKDEKVIRDQWSSLDKFKVKNSIEILNRRKMVEAILDTTSSGKRNRKVDRYHAGIN